VSIGITSHWQTDATATSVLQLRMRDELLIRACFIDLDSGPRFIGAWVTELQTPRGRRSLAPNITA